MKPSDMLFGPTRSAAQQADGSWIVTVTPPAIVQLPAQTVALTNAQYERFLRWVAGLELMQEALPDLSAADREILMTGIGNDDFHRITDEEED